MTPIELYKLLIAMQAPCIKGNCILFHQSRPAGNDKL